MPDPSSTTARRPAYEVRPRGCPRLVLALLSVSDVLLAMRTAGANASDGEVRRECLRHSLREVGETPVTYLDLQGKGLSSHLPRTRHRTLAGTYFGRLHEPSLDERTAALEGVVVEDAGDVERWKVTLADGRVVTLEEQGEETVEQALKQARRASQSGAYVELATVLESLRQAVVQIDDRALTPDALAGRGWDALFRVKETLLLSVIFMELQSGGQDAMEEAAQDVLVPLGSESASSGS